MPVAGCLKKNKGDSEQQDAQCMTETEVMARTPLANQRSNQLLIFGESVKPFADAEPCGYNLGGSSIRDDDFCF